MDDLIDELHAEVAGEGAEAHREDPTVPAVDLAAHSYLGPSEHLLGRRSFAG